MSHGDLARRVRGFIGRREAARRVIRPFLRVPPGRRWLFVVGCYNSGTTLLQALLARSPTCTTLPLEGVVLTSQLWAPELEGWPRMWWKVWRGQVARKPGDVADPERVKRDWCIWLDRDRPVFLEKSISNTTRMPWLAEHFEGARFVHILRNGYAVAEGIRRRAGTGRVRLPEGLSRYPIEWCATQWVRSADVLAQATAEIGADLVFTLRYEDLCRSPAEWLGRVGEFAGLQELSGGDLSHVRDMNRDALSRLSAEDMAAVNRVAAGDIERLGYEVLIADRLPGGET